MLKRNLTLNKPLLQRKEPTILKETAGDITPSSLPPFETGDHSSNNTSRGSSSTGTNAGLPSWLGQRPATLDERFQLAINSNKQKNDTPEKSNVILNDVLSKKYASAILEVAKRNKQNAGDVFISKNKPTDSTGTPVRPQAGDQAGPRGKTKVPGSPARVLTDEQSELAAIVDKLPENFDLSKWEEMTAFQQQKALKNSGLTGEEQMKLLNAPTSIITIATIQDIQTNRAEYGLTQASADHISSELLKIANARIGVSNRALPFASDFQRNLFLQQLDKEEQKLLESVGGQKNSGRDMLFKNDQHDDFAPSAETSAIRVVENVDHNSKAGKIAKNILKYYLNACFINRIDTTISNMHYISSIINTGTISVGVSANASILGAGGLTGNVGLVMDTDGDVGLIKTYGGFGGIPTFSIVGFASVSNAKEIEDLEDFAFEAGGSIGELLCAGGEISTFKDKTDHLKIAVNLLGGAGASALPVEGHVGLTYTAKIEPLFNLYDEWANFLEEYRAW